MQWYQYLVGPLLGAFIGWLTNWIAVKMLFHPKREFNLLGIRIQGLIPKRRREMTRRVSEIVEEEIVSHQDLRVIIESADLASPILRHIETRVADFLTKQLESLPGLVRSFIGPEMIQKTRFAVIREVKASIPKLTDELVTAVQTKVDLKKIIGERLDEVDVDQFEGMVNRLAERELRSIVVAGAVLGFLIGMIQSLWLWLFM